tara:strand:- start:1058 stop:2485 length:1428 start_codon:yes stop_codon:yes gene_type:complete
LSPSEEEVLNWLAERNLMPSPELVSHVTNQPDGITILENSVGSITRPLLFLGLSDLVEETISVQPPKQSPVVSNAPPVIIKDQIEKSTADGSLNNFVSLFNDRLRHLSKLLYQNPKMRGARNLNYLDPGSEISCIGIVSSIGQRYNNRRKVILEDGIHQAAVYLEDSDANPLLLVPDEVIGVIGRVDRRGRAIYSNEPIIRPHWGRVRESTRAEQPHTALFVSDVHLGSLTFQSKEWKRFIEWLNGNTDLYPDWVPNGGYLIIDGDIVDGIDSYPDQEKDLAIKDVWVQYETLADEIKNMPSDLQIVILPGNHDAVRLMEPQLPLPDHVKDKFPPNVTFTANPVTIDIAGVNVLCYHGKSLDDLVSFPGLSYEDPISLMKELIKRRHLAPIYGGKTPLATENKDYLVIKEVPDIFVTGHVHSCGVDYYKGTLLINPGTWQAQTSYQKMMGFQPDPCRAVAVNLQSLHSETLDFNF